ncbi:hypothetical protein SporoP37_11915 [Sporosarcina sp. P37]|nr:hypothetical protein SporoP33_11525 [Sporosarcina sp. P33]ARK25293.1 hypothetical protein SporoP37_11915 [Sporosarcina sp. P37]PID17528.1 hypothetical protein CSV62_12910 [Sporosarcina sp. P35]
MAQRGPMGKRPLRSANPHPDTLPASQINKPIQSTNFTLQYVNNTPLTTRHKMQAKIEKQICRMFDKENAL